MSIKEYIERLNKIKQDSINRWENLSTAEREIFEGSYEWLLDNLNIKRGEVQSDEELTTQMDAFLEAVVTIVNTAPAYRSTLTEFLTDLGRLKALTAEFHASAHGFNINTAGVTEAQKTVVNEVLNQYLENGLRQEFAIPLRDNIFRKILLGARIKDVKQVLQDYILAGKDETGKLGKYAHNLAIQSIDSYSGAINMRINQEFTFTGYVISGSLIETSSLQCIYAVEESDKGYFDFKQWKKVLIIAAGNKKAPLIPGTTIDNLPLNKLHWGCRHDFTPTIK